MEDPCQGETVLKSDEAMQPMQDGKALHHDQTGTGNTSQTKRTSSYLKNKKK